MMKKIFVYDSQTKCLNKIKKQIYKTLIKINSFFSSKQGKLLVRVCGAILLITILILNRRLTIGSLRCLAAENKKNFEELQKPTWNDYWEKFKTKTRLERIFRKKRYVLVPMTILVVGGAILHYTYLQTLIKETNKLKLKELLYASQVRLNEDLTIQVSDGSKILQTFLKDRSKNKACLSEIAKNYKLLAEGALKVNKALLETQYAYTQNNGSDASPLYPIGYALLKLRKVINDQNGFTADLAAQIIICRQLKVITP